MINYETENKAEIEALPGLESRASQLLLEVGIKNLLIKVLEDDGCEPSIEFGDTGIGIYITHYDKPSIIDEKTVRKLGYQVYSTSYDPGVRYYSDGSGEPPSVDIVNEGKISDHRDDAITEAIALVAKMRIAWLQESEADRAADEYELKNV